MTSRVIPRPLPPAGALAWAGGAAYLLAVALLFGAAPRASGLVHAAGALLASALLLGLLRRTPTAALALALVGATALITARPNAGPEGSATAYQGQFLAFLAADAILGHLVATRPRRTAVVAVAVSSAVQLLVIGGFAHGDNLFAHLIIAVLATVASCITGQLSRERSQHAQALRAQEVAEAVSAERLRIARELHDMVAHSIGVIAIQAGVGSRIIASRPAEAGEALRTIEATSRETLAGLRRTLVSLRHAGQDASPLVPAPGLADLEGLVAATADAGVRVELRRTGDRRSLPTDLELAAYRIVQEALTNVVRHAGTDHCRVTVHQGGTELGVEIVDDGRGTPADRGGHGFGLVGMGERVALLGGRLSAAPRPEGGFRVAADLPLPTPDSARVEVR